MMLKRLTYIAVLIFIPDYVVLQTVSKSKDPENYIPCEHGWYNFKEKCYKISGAAEHLDWDKSADHCTTIGANLVTIESKEENDFLVGLLLLEIERSAWIGLHDQVNESDYRWHSGSKSEYRNWREGEPSGSARLNEDCVQLLVDLFHDSVGEWNDNDCKHSSGYICEKKISPDKESRNLQNCSSAEGGGFRFHSSCYHLVTESKSWEDAEQHCINNYGAHLITVLDKTVDFYLKYLFQSIESELWIGIKIRDEFQQKWASGWYVGYNGFRDKQPYFVEGTCVIRKRRKEWDIVPCSRKYSFICEKSHENPPVLKLPPKGYICPSEPKGWRDMGGEFCYYIETEKSVSWYEANLDCIRRDANLVSLHSKAESELLHPFFKHSHVASYIGLVRYYNGKDVFKWTDGSQLDFLNWNPGEPNNANEICAEARAADMTWNDIDCKNKRPFICSVRKIIPHSTTEDPNGSSIKPNSSTTEHFDGHLKGLATPTSNTAGQSNEQVNVSGHISNKILIGVVVCSILVIIVLSVIVYKFRLCSKKTIDAQLHNYKDMNDQDC